MNFVLKYLLICDLVVNESDESSFGFIGKVTD